MSYNAQRDTVYEAVRLSMPLSVNPEIDIARILKPDMLDSYDAAKFVAYFYAGAAVTQSEYMFPDDPIGQDIARHAVWTLILFQAFGYDGALKITTNYEELTPDNPPLDKSMDLYNNKAAADIARDNINSTSDLHDVIKPLVLSEMDNGKFVYVNNGVLVPYGVPTPTGIVMNKTTVYSGPSSSLYTSDNSSAGPNDTVILLWKEGNFYYIEYPAGTNKKRMYIPINAVTSITNDVAPLHYSLLTRYGNKSANTYFGPGSDYPVNGSINTGDEVTFISPVKVNGYAFIEYNIDNHKERAWVDAMNLNVSKPTVKKLRDAINNTISFDDNGNDGHKDYAVAVGQPVYAMCDGTFKFGYSYGKKEVDDDLSYISLGRGVKLYPDSDWVDQYGKTVSSIEYGHLSSLSGYSTPDYVEQCQGSSWSSCHEKHSVTLAEVKVTCGDLIGYSGNSGNSTGPHLHIKVNN